jgi:hypothetical protein
MKIERIRSRSDEIDLSQPIAVGHSNSMEITQEFLYNSQVEPWRLSSSG